jgi:hypothetical protein
VQQGIILTPLFLRSQKDNMEEKQLSEKESLQLITEMISKAKHSYHENGSSAILWGTVVAVCGFVRFAELYFHFYIGFDIWLLTLVAFIPQIFISISERKNRKVVSHTEAAMNTIWVVYAISMFALVFYFNIVPGVSDRFLAGEGVKILVTSADGNTHNFHYDVPSAGSLLILMYAIPTFATALAYKFRPMIYASVLCYAFFIVSCFTPTAYDMLLNGLAGIFNWLIPGIILRRRFKKEKEVNVQGT